MQNELCLLPLSFTLPSHSNHGFVFLCLDVLLVESPLRDLLLVLVLSVLIRYAKVRVGEKVLRGLETMVSFHDAHDYF